MTRIALIATVLVTVALSAAGVGRAEPAFTVEGEPICGSFAYKWLPEELKQAQQAGINLVFCYEHTANRALLDPETELGRIALEGGTGVLANFLRYAGSARLLENLGPDDDTVRMTAVGSLPETGTLVLDDELIEYSGKQEQAVIASERGARGTEPASHTEGTFLFEESMLIDHLNRVKDSPTLWGFWVLDDKKGNQATALRNFTRIVREHDVDEDGDPLGHLIIAGMSNPEALTNFTEDCCDLAGVYIYPARRGAYRTSLTHNQLREMIPTMRAIDPAAKFIGIYQAFHGTSWEPKPTPLQVRQQVTDFLHWGASGVMAYSWRMIKDHATLNTMDDLRAEVSEIAEDLREGRLQVDQQPPDVEPVPDYVPPEGPRTPVLSFAEGMELPGTAGTPRAELAPIEGEEEPWLHLRFAEYIEGPDQWPGIRFNAGHPAVLRRDWSAFGGLVLRVRNFLQVASEIGVVIHGPRGMWARYYPLEADAITEVAVDLREVAGATPIERIRRVGLIMRRPPVDTHMAVQGAWLLPLRVEVAEDASLEIPRIDAAPEEAAWGSAAAIALRDPTGIPAVKPCTVRLLRSAEALHVRFDCAAPEPEVLRARDTERDAPMAGEDRVEVLLRLEDGTLARLQVNPLGAVRDELIAPSGPDSTWGPDLSVTSDMSDATWRVTLSLPLSALPSPLSAFSFTRHDTELRSLSWPAERVRGGMMAFGRLD